MSFFYNKVIFFYIDWSLHLFFLCFFGLFVVDLLQRIVMLLTVSFFMLFALKILMTKFNSIIIGSNFVCQYVVNLEF